jgi:hypothetical protein
MLPPSFLCPRCNGNALYREHRRGFDWLVSILGLRPVRCFTCHKRIYMRRSLIEGRQEDRASPAGASRESNESD